MAVIGEWYDEAMRENVRLREMLADVMDNHAQEAYMIDDANWSLYEILRRYPATQCPACHGGKYNDEFNGPCETCNGTGVKP